MVVLDTINILVLVHPLMSHLGYLRLGDLNPSLANRIESGASWWVPVMRQRDFSRLLLSPA